MRALVPRSADMPPLEMWMRSWKRRFIGLQFCPQPVRANANYSANFFTDHFAFADSMPYHARSRPALGGHAAAGDVDAKLEETIYRSSVLPSAVPCQCVITQPIFSQIILPLQIPCHTMRALVPCQCLRGHARRRCAAAAVQPPPYLVISVLNLPKLIYYILNISKYI
jgi:hypothetical protein